MHLLEELDYKLYDYLSLIDRVKPDTNASSHVVIIDVDEKSLNEFGAWPWSRLIDAGLLAKVNAHKPAVIAFNFLFTQADAYGAKTIQDFYQKTFHQTMDISGIDKNLQDSDKVFAN
jgi:adenylate cyclase